MEDLFRRVKAQLRTRPIYHSGDAAIYSHVFCSFLALVLQKELADRCRTAGVIVEWDNLVRDIVAQGGDSLGVGGLPAVGEVARGAFGLAASFHFR